MENITRASELAMMESVYKRYLRTNTRELADVYGRYSTNKACAMRGCRELCESLNGWGLKIISYNTNQFSVGFEYPNTETGEVMFAYITKAHNRTCPTTF